MFRLLPLVASVKKPSNVLIALNNGEQAGQKLYDYQFPVHAENNQHDVVLAYFAGGSILTPQVNCSNQQVNIADSK